MKNQIIFESQLQINRETDKERRREIEKQRK
jgi:hypothetical protein